jgi:hypothetical protein
MFMSYPAVNHVEIKLEQRAGGTHIDLRHRALGMIDPAHREGVTKGWRHMLQGVAENAATRTAAPQRA